MELDTDIYAYQIESLKVIRNSIDCSMDEMQSHNSHNEFRMHIQLSIAQRIFIAESAGILAATILSSIGICYFKPTEVHTNYWYFLKVIIWIGPFLPTDFSTSFQIPVFCFRFFHYSCLKLVLQN